MFNKKGRELGRHFVAACSRGYGCVGRGKELFEMLFPNAVHNV